MIVYHGSNQIFREPAIKKFTSEDALMEGYGFYITENPFTAMQYGRYLYEVYICQDCTWDFTKKTECERFLSMLCTAVKKKFRVSIQELFDFDQLVKMMAIASTTYYKLGVTICEMIMATEHAELTDFLMDELEYYIPAWINQNLNCYLYRSGSSKNGIIRHLNPDWYWIESRMDIYTKNKLQIG